METWTAEMMKKKIFGFYYDYNNQCVIDTAIADESNYFNKELWLEIFAFVYGKYPDTQSKSDGMHSQGGDSDPLWNELLHVYEGLSAQLEALNAYKESRMKIRRAV